MVRFVNNGSFELKYATAGSAGIDLPYQGKDSIDLLPGERRLIPTGISIELPLSLEAQVRPRSGLALKYGITVVNSPGTIDSDYRGEIGVILLNTGNTVFNINPGDRIAQLVIAPFRKVTLMQVDSLDETDRGAGGFGSTGE